MQNQETWHAGNQYSTRLFIYIALILNALQGLTFLVLNRELAFILTGLFITIGVACIMVLTERYLKERFE